MFRRAKQLSLLCLLALSAAPAQAQLAWLFGGGGIECAPLDSACVAAHALAEVEGMMEDTSVNNFGKAFGALWPYLDQDVRQPVLDTYLERPDGNGVIRHMNIALAKAIPDDAEVAWLSALLDDPSVVGDLPIDYYAPSLAIALLATDPEGVADLAITKGDAFEEMAIDALYRTIAWMARNDQTRLEAYLAAYDPRPASYFTPSIHLFRIAGELCTDGDKDAGTALHQLTLRDMLRTRVTTSERFAFPMRSVLACEGTARAADLTIDLMNAVASDLERLRETGTEGAFVIQRIVKAVNEDGLAPVIRALHAEGKEEDAAALAEALLPVAQIILSVGADQTITQTREERIARLGEVLRPDPWTMSNLDPETVLSYFLNEFKAEDHLNAADYAESAVGPIISVWPDQRAQDAAAVVRPMLADKPFKVDSLMRLDMGVAKANAQNCILSEAALTEVLTFISEVEFAVVRVIALVDYLDYLKVREVGAPEVCP